MNLVERLRYDAGEIDIETNCSGWGNTYREAADRIEELEKVNENYKEQIKELVKQKYRGEK